MWERLRYAIGFTVGLLCLLALLPDTVSVWVDEAGHTYLTDREAPPAPGAERLPPDALGRGWAGRVTGEPLAAASEGSDAEGRFARTLAAARDDLARGEVKRGLTELRRLHRERPARLEVAVVLAEVERRRGRLLAAQEVIEGALSYASERSDHWQDAAETLRRELAEEVRFAAESGTHGRMQPFDGEHFTIVYNDHNFGGRDYGERVLTLLEQVRARARQSLGRTLEHSLEVRLYTRADYLDAYQHRFGFATVGFYDGAIHVVAARHPRRELYALLLHEYAHALFADALGGHRPFFLNEGIADGEEERARGRPRLSRGEWRRLLDALRSDSWIPLASLVKGFDEVEGKQALLAYLESRAAIELLEHEHPGVISRWLQRCARGAPWQAALAAETGWDTRGLEAALQAAVRSRFPEDPLARARIE